MNTPNPSYSNARQVYRPAPDRIPGWLRRMWHWF